jgi:hypothetical protein
MKEETRRGEHRTHIGSFIDIRLYSLQLLTDSKTRQAKEDYGTILQGKSRVISNKMQMSVQNIAFWRGNMQD